MTINEAIREIKVRLSIAEKNYSALVPEYIEALKMAVDALEKQEQVKPQACHVAPMYQGWHYGPVRATALVHYCPNCGQVIDWREE